MGQRGGQPFRKAAADTSPFRGQNMASCYQVLPTILVPTTSELLTSREPLCWCWEVAGLLMGKLAFPSTLSYSRPPALGCTSPQRASWQSSMATSQARGLLTAVGKRGSETVTHINGRKAVCSLWFVVTAFKWRLITMTLSSL